MANLNGRKVVKSNLDDETVKNDIRAESRFSASGVYTGAHSHIVIHSCPQFDTRNVESVTIHHDVL